VPRCAGVLVNRQCAERLTQQGNCCGLPLASATEGAYLASIGQMQYVRTGGTYMVELNARIAQRDFYFP
jgi:hypothetical protein